MEKIDSAEFDKVRANLEKYPLFKELLSEDWINAKILNQETDSKNIFYFGIYLMILKQNFFLMI